MSDSYYSRIEKNIDSFPSLPSTVAEVMNVVNHPDSSAKELTQAILPDQSMCVAILKLANSVLYGRPKKVSSLETAITVLGFDEIQNIVLTRSVLSSFGSVFKRNDQIISDFWDHSYTCALAAKVIAEHFSISSPGRFFIGGLIHDIGKLAMLLTFPEEYPADQWLVGFSTKDKLNEERQLFSITHEEVGSRLLEKWNFPEALSNGLQYHHCPVECEKHRGFPLIIQLADALAYICCNMPKEEVVDISLLIEGLLPGIEENWQQNNLPLDKVKLDMWYSWAEIERKHGNSILSILVV